LFITINTYVECRCSEKKKRVTAVTGS